MGDGETDLSCGVGLQAVPLNQDVEVDQDDQLTVVAGEQGLEGLVMDIGGVAIPNGHQPQLVEYHAERSVPPTIQR